MILIDETKYTQQERIRLFYLLESRMIQYKQVKK